MAFIFIAVEGGIYRLDQVTGEGWVSTNGEWIKIKEPR